MEEKNKKVSLLSFDVLALYKKLVLTHIVIRPKKQKQ